MTAIVAHQSGETLARPASGQVLPGEFVLQDGTPAMIWPLLPTDAETLREGFRRLSPGSRRHRFLQVLDQLDDPMIRLLVDSIDGVHHIALLLIVLPPEGEEELIGVAHLVQDPADPATADMFPQLPQASLSRAPLGAQPSGHLHQAPGEQAAVEYSRPVRFLLPPRE